MNPEQWARVKEIFHAALAQEESRRRAFVAEAAADDALVRAEVERLLDADRGASGFIEYPAVDALLSGRTIGRYEIGRLLGAGGMGRVYAARDRELGREVALKIAAVESEDAQARLRREAQHASRLSHPHICHVYEVGRADGRVFVVMELVPGRSLADLLRDGPLPMAAARQYGLEIADALAHAHEEGVTHRDLKSTNVMITPKRGAKVLDFGLARMLDSHQIDALSHSQASLSTDGLLAGTLSYMPPELLRGQRGDQRADIWALGVLLYEMVTGRRPFTGATGFELSAAILHQPPAAMPPEVPAGMRAIIDRCLAKDPSDRYQTAADVHRALEQMQETAGTPGEPATGIAAVPKAAIAGLALLVVAALAVASMLSERGAVSTVFSNARGYSLLHTGQFEAALAEFKGAADQNPEDANAWDSLGEGYLASGMPDKALEAYSRALTLDATYGPSVLGRSLALAALGQYEQALTNPSSDPTVHAWLLSRVGRYRAAAELLAQIGRESKDDGDGEPAAVALLTSAWLLIEQQQYARALEEIRAAETALPAGESKHPALVLADLLAVVAHVRAGNLKDAIARHASQRARADDEERIEANWVAAADGEIAIGQAAYERATLSFNAAQTPAWLTLGRNALALFAMNPPSRDGRARVEVARGNRVDAIEEYRRLTTAGAGVPPAAMLDPRHVLALARLLEEHQDAAAARTEYQRFLRLWANADPDLPEIKEARSAIARLPPP